MHIGDFPMAQRIIEARSSLIRQRDEAKLGVTLGGAYQDEEMVQAVRPIVVHVLNDRIGELEKDLKALGIRFD